MHYSIAAYRDNSKPEILLNKYYFPDMQEGMLTRREIEVLKWICEGLTSKELADKLYISAYTVNNHRANILQKTNCSNFSEVLKFAILNGII